MRRQAAKKLDVVNATWRWTGAVFPSKCFQNLEILAAMGHLNLENSQVVGKPCKMLTPKWRGLTQDRNPMHTWDGITHNELFTKIIGMIFFSLLLSPLLFLVKCFNCLYK